MHVPFCRTKCGYCAFLSQTDLKPASAWADAVAVEAQVGTAPSSPFQTLYVGGGTPTVLPMALLQELIHRLRGICRFTDAAEITVEANPDDVTPELMGALCRCGMTRLSLGVQSFRDEELRFLGRRHTADQARAAIDMARDAGVTNLSLDLMYGFRGQRRDEWHESLEEAVAWRPEHLSCYQLTIEPETPFGRRVAAGLLTPVPESKEYAFFVATSERLGAHGYHHYEVSNFALPGYRSRHNRIYWSRGPYRGFGPGAHSFDGWMRWWNVRSVYDYVRRLAEGSSPVADREILTDEQTCLEWLMLGFRTDEGVAVEVVSRYRGWAETLDRLQRSGFVSQRGERIVPTIRGMAIADRLPLEFAGQP